jgi:hypothetical protein
MSAKSRAGKATWAARAVTYRQDLTDRIAADATARTDAWNVAGRIPVRVRIMARLAGRPLRLPDSEARR